MTVLSELGIGTHKKMLLRKCILQKNLSQVILICEHRTANACYKDAADLLAELDQFSQAIARYEQVADHSLNSALTKYSVKEYWLRALLCALAMNVYVLTFFFVLFFLWWFRIL